MEWVKGIIAKLIGKNMADGTSAVSKTKLVAIIAVLMTAINTLPPAFGHAPIVVPDWVYKLLAGAGLWSLRDSLPDTK